jgi:hypothetical protein
VPLETIRVFNTILYENEFQNPELFPTQVSLSPEPNPEQSTLASAEVVKADLLRIPTDVKKQRNKVGQNTQTSSITTVWNLKQSLYLEVGGFMRKSQKDA